MPASVPPEYPAGRPAIIGHRGAPRERPENTLAGFARALELGVDAIELDVHATRDGVLVVHHDPELPGVAEAGGAIGRLDWPAIVGRGDGAPPRLSEVLDLAAGRATVYVELKGATLERLVADLLRSHRARCAVHAFDHRAVAALRDIAPEIPRGILQCSRLVDSRAALAAAGAVTLWQQWPLVDAALVREVAGMGGEVIAWTVNDPDAMRALAAWGVAGICTDDPALAARVLGER